MIHGEKVETNRKILFLHIPKTAGTSFALALDRISKPSISFGEWIQLRDMADEQLLTYNVITGHFYAFQLDRPCLAPYTKVTVLRDPLERCISSYNFARWCVEMGTADQRQTFAAQVSLFEYFMSSVGVSDRHSQLYLLGLNDGDDAKLMPLNILRERAERRLSTMIVAVVPRLQLALTSFRALLGCESNGTLPVENVTPERHKIDCATADELEIMRRVLAEDYALYHFAWEQCESFIANTLSPHAQETAWLVSEEQEVTWPVAEVHEMAPPVPEYHEHDRHQKISKWHNLWPLRKR